MWADFPDWKLVVVGVVVITSAIYHSISEKISIPFTCSRVTTGKVKGNASHLTYIVLLEALHSDIGASCQALGASKLRDPHPRQASGAWQDGHQ